MDLIIIGTVKQVQALQGGVSTAGKEWKKQDFVITTQEQYAKDVCIQAFNKTTEYVDNLQIGDNVQVSFNIESKEYQGKYYTQVTAWKIEKINATFESKPKNEPTYQNEVKNANEVIENAMDTKEMQDAIKRSQNAYKQIPEMELIEDGDLPF